MAGMLTLLLAGSVALAAPPDPPDEPEDKGQVRTEEPKIQGSSTEPSGWGTVTSQRGSTEHDVGEHSSDPLSCEEFPEFCDNGVSGRETPRKGLGNVARTDSGAGDQPGDHGCLVGESDLIGSTDCEGDPGLP